MCNYVDVELIVPIPSNELQLPMCKVLENKTYDKGRGILTILISDSVSAYRFQHLDTLIKVDFVIN